MSVIASAWNKIAFRIEKLRRLLKEKVYLYLTFQSWFVRRKNS